MIFQPALRGFFNYDIFFVVRIRFRLAVALCKHQTSAKGGEIHAEELRTEKAVKRSVADAQGCRGHGCRIGASLQPHGGAVLATTPLIF
ncbi:MAG: hypothetical protein A3H70_02785 [Candidatus Komeilibacteria bacterium RIFCSPLOWO2_02_FULL_48_11]|uniref:Uncharacterized protein n=1 Tax=Candidatus Komeilibacteria bacterium RIFCSPLOWO2_02_FULL_48_11 TaxID=1798553 RepID=A0A1G2BVU3_9BACT|nr:MAG: hypothetical protein A3H70_02785 [Candidatus Komeilibacteria bacterium RIFCSPLOWO2_02_FULL_48_11]